MVGVVLNTYGCAADYADPFNFLNYLLDGTHSPYLDDRAYNRKLAAAASLSGPQRYRVYAALDAELARDAAPLAAIGTPTSRDFFSARIGCHIYQPVYGFDLAALCLRRAGG